MPSLEPASGVAAPNKKFQPFRKITTMEEALDAQRAAAGLGVLIMLGYAMLFLLIALAPDRVPIPQEAGDTAINIGAIIVATLMTVWVWMRRSLIATVLLTIWFLFERLATAIMAPQTINFVSIMILVLGISCAILAIRGHIEAGKIRKAPPTDARVFD